MRPPRISKSLQSEHDAAPLGSSNPRMGDRNDCAHYLECLTDASKRNLRLLPCAGCQRFEVGVVEREYFQRRDVEVG